MKNITSLSTNVPAKAASDLFVFAAFVETWATLLSFLDDLLDFLEDLFNIAGENDE